MFFRIIAIAMVLLGLSAPSYADNYLTFSGLILSPGDPEILSTDGISNSVLTRSGAEIQTDLSVGVSIAAGMRFDSPLRAEIEYAYRSFGSDQVLADFSDTEDEEDGQEANIDGDFTIHSWMVNFVYDLETFSELTPYVGFGLGLAFHNGSLDEISEQPSGLDNGKKTTFAYQLLVGAYYLLMEGVEAGVGYRYFSTADPDYGFLKAEMDMHNFELSLRYNF